MRQTLPGPDKGGFIVPQARDNHGDLAGGDRGLTESRRDTKQAAQALSGKNRCPRLISPDAAL